MNTQQQSKWHVCNESDDKIYTWRNSKINLIFSFRSGKHIAFLLLFYTVYFSSLLRIFISLIWFLCLDNFGLIFQFRQQGTANKTWSQKPTNIVLTITVTVVWIQQTCAQDAEQMKEHYSSRIVATETKTTNRCTRRDLDSVNSKKEHDSN